MSLTITRQSVVTPTIDNQHSWPLKITSISNTPNLPSEIFVFRAAMNDDPYNGDAFQCVASLSQIEELTTSPVSTDENYIPFYRSDTLNLVFRSVEELQYYWNEIQKRRTRSLQ
jgi:hypothetical protein